MRLNMKHFIRIRFLLDGEEDGRTRTAERVEKRWNVKEDARQLKGGCWNTVRFKASFHLLRLLFPSTVGRSGG